MLLRYYKAWRGNSIPTFLDHLSVISTRVKMYREVVPKRQYGITLLRCVISQKSAGLNYIEAEA